MKLQTVIVPVEWKATDADNTLEGYASTFGNVDLQYDVIAKGAFKNTIPAVRKGDIPLLADHSTSVRDVLGTLVEASEDAKGLKIKARFSSDPDAQAIRQKMLDGHVSKMSIGYQPLTWRYENRGEDRVRVLEDIKLWEVSAVVFPANPQAVIDRVKSAVRQSIDAAVTGAVANGGDEREIKAALADWAKNAPLAAAAPQASATDETTSDAEPPAPADDDKDATERTPDMARPTHLDTEDAEDSKSAEPDQDDHSGPLTLTMRRADAVLAGRDPDEVADPVQLAGLTTRLDLLDEWVQQSTREAKLTDELNALRGNR